MYLREGLHHMYTHHYKQMNCWDMLLLGILLNREPRNVGVNVQLLLSNRGEFTVKMKLYITGTILNKGDYADYGKPP